MHKASRAYDEGGGVTVETNRIKIYRKEAAVLGSASNCRKVTLNECWRWARIRHRDISMSVRGIAWV